jgi:hypothetical protein
VDELTWPDRWQPDAIEALLPYLDTDARVRIVLDDPKVAVSGTVIEGHVYVENGEPMIVHDRSGRPDVFPWRLLLGPVQRIELLIPSRRRSCSSSMRRFETEKRVTMTLE